MTRIAYLDARLARQARATMARCGGAGVLVAVTAMLAMLAGYGSAPEVALMAAEFLAYSLGAFAGWQVAEAVKAVVAYRQEATRVKRARVHLIVSAFETARA